MTPRIALVAHDKNKLAIVALATEFLGALRFCRLCATGTTGGLIAQRLGLHDLEARCRCTSRS